MLLVIGCGFWLFVVVVVLWVVVYFFYLVWIRFVTLVSFAMGWLVFALWWCLRSVLIVLVGCDLD